MKIRSHAKRVLTGGLLCGLLVCVFDGQRVHATSSQIDALNGALTNIYTNGWGSSTTTSNSSMSLNQLSSSLLGTTGTSNLGQISSGYSTPAGGYTTSTGSLGTGTQGGTAEVNGRRVITYYPIYNAQRQQQVNIQQRVQQQVKQNFDVSGNAYYSYTNGGTTDVSGNTVAGSALAGTIDQWTQALTPDIAALESDPVGPIVNTVSLAESYHENYQIYEERFSDLYAIYTNIPNGSISNRPVIFDVPNGVSVRMSRDGRAASFTNKAQIKQEGTYVVQFYVTQDGSEELPAWQQTIERARFVFRIQYTAGLDGTPLNIAEPSELESFADLVQEDSQTLLPGTTEEQPQEPAEPVEETPAEEPKEEKPDGIVSAASGLTTTYDESSGYYRIGLLTGDEFSANIPDGMVTNDAVMILPADGIRYELYREGAETEFTPGEFLSESGDYILIPVIDNLDYESYYRVNRPMMRFRIVNEQVADLGAFTAPETMSISAVRHNGEDVTKQALISDTTATLPEDGRWEVELTGEAGTKTVAVLRDTVPPKVSIKTEPNAAHISYESDDIVSATLTRGEELVSDGQLITIVTKTGRYHLVVRDVAGNVAEHDFNVQYRINVFAILAIVMVIGLIGALVIFLRRVKTSVRVR
ncbi:MAG: hypothetical protein K6G16_01500 [Lachnospiraceae bacterium]|nr:hypothetical protein [Lachnospiraceae bacterium]